MGVLWTVWPLDAEIKSWLDEMAVAYPNAASRFPTGAEIKTVLEGLLDYDVEITDNGIGACWQAMITHKNGGDKGPWTLLNISKYSGDNELQELWFEKGWEELIQDILKNLSSACGPLVLIPDTGDVPRGITSVFQKIL
jgi:hypothetical protein